MSERAAAALLYLYIAAVGSVIGSFLGVVVWRLPRGLSVAKGRSFCPSCGRKLSPRDLVPVFSWLFLRGRCRSCGAAIPARELFTELAGAAFACGAVARFGPGLEALCVFAALCVLLCIALIDADTMEIPDSLLLALAVPAAGLAALQSGAPLLSRVIGFFAVSVPVWLLTLAIPGSFGGGDVKLFAVCGFLLGWRELLAAAFFSLLLGGGWGVYLLASKRAGRRDHFAFGPCIAAGTALALFFGYDIIILYLRAFQLA